MRALLCNCFISDLSRIMVYQHQVAIAESLLVADYSYEIFLTIKTCNEGFSGNDVKRAIWMIFWLKHKILLDKGLIKLFMIPLLDDPQSACIITMVPFLETASYVITIKIKAIELKFFFFYKN